MADSSAKFGAVLSLIEAAPDAALRGLDAALVGADGEAMGKIKAAIRAEQKARGFRADVFAPLTPLTQPRADGVAAPTLPATVLGALWRELKRRHPELIARAAAARDDWRDDDPDPREYDDLCVLAAAILREEPAVVAPGLDAATIEMTAGYLDFAPLARQALHRLPDWLGKATDERVAALKLTFRDATTLANDGAPRLLEIMLAHVSEAHLIMRLISALTDRAGDRYLASSELAGFGARLLDNVDRRIERVRGFDIQSGADGARAIARDVSAATSIMATIDQTVELSREGPWGARIAAARKTLAGAVESRLREVEAAVSKALPLQNVRIAGRMTRPAPKLVSDPDPRAVECARGLVVLLADLRSSAAVGGYGALRNQIADSLTERMTVYADEVLHLINAREAPDEDRARVYLELSAEFMGYAKDEQAAQIIRRRAAVAGDRSPAQDVA